MTHVVLPQRRNSALQLEAGSSRKRLLDAVRSRGLPPPAAGGRMLTSAKKTIALQRLTGTGVHASGHQLQPFTFEYQSSCSCRESRCSRRQKTQTRRGWRGCLVCPIQNKRRQERSCGGCKQRAGAGGQCGQYRRCRATKGRRAHCRPRLQRAGCIWRVQVLALAPQSLLFLLPSIAARLLHSV
jgi:hypothetical protein